VSELVGSVFMGLADAITDGITYARLRSGDIAAPNEGFKAAYTTALCFGVVTTMLSLAYRLRNARLMRAHVLELGQQGRAVRVSEARRQAQQHEWELAQTHRTKVVASLALLSVGTQGKASAQRNLHTYSDNVLGSAGMEHAQPGMLRRTRTWLHGTACVRRGCRPAHVEPQLLPRLHPK
jgi:hypothetical protein